MRYAGFHDWLARASRVSLRAGGRLLIRLGLPLFIALVAVLPSAWAQTLVTWDGDTSTTFSSGSNWVGGTAPNLSSATANIGVFGAEFGTFAPLVTATAWIGGLQFERPEGGWTVTIDSGRVLQIGNSGINASTMTSSGTLTFNGNVDLRHGTSASGGSPQTWNSGAGTIVVTGTLRAQSHQRIVVPAGSTVRAAHLNGTSTTDFVKASAGTMIVTGPAGSAMQPFFVTAGTLIIGDGKALSRPGAIGALTLGVTNAFGNEVFQATKDLTGADALTNSINVLGRAPAISGNFSIEVSGSTYRSSNDNNNGSRLTNNIVAGKQLTLNQVSLTSRLEFDGTGDTVIQGEVSGSRGLVKWGTGTLRLSGSNGSTGGTVLNDGTLELNHEFAAGPTTTTLTVNGGTLDLGGRNVTKSGSVRFNGGLVSSGTLTNDTQAFDGQRGSVTATLAGTAGLTKSTTGVLVLSGSNSYSGVTTLNATGGTLQFATRNALYGGDTGLWTAANVVVNTGGTLGLSLGSSGEFSSADVTTLLTRLGGLGGAVDNNGLRSGARIGFDTTNALGETFTIADNLANSTGTGGGAIGITKLGSGTLTLSGSNSYTGQTTVQGGVLRMGSATAFGSGNVVVTAGVVDLNGFGATVSALTVGGDSETDVTGGGTLTIGGDVTYTSSPAGSRIETGLNLGGATRTFTVGGDGSGANALTVSGPISSAGGITKVGTGRLLLDGTSSFTGQTILQAGVLEIASVANAGANSAVGAATGTSARIDLGTGTTVPTLRYVGAGHATDRGLYLAGGADGGAILEAAGTGAVAFTSGVTAAAGTKTFTLTGTSTATNSIGSIAGTGVSIDKTGPSLWQLTGASSFTGRLTVSDGTIVAAAGAGQEAGDGVFGSGVDLDQRPLVGTATAGATGQAAILLESGVLINRGLVIAPLGSEATQEAILGMASSSGTATFGGGGSIRLGRDLTLQAAAGGTVEFENQWRDLNDGQNPAVAFNVGSAGNAGTVVFGSFLPDAITAVNVRRGTLRLDGGTETIGRGTPITLGEAGSGGTLDVNGITQPLASLSFTGVGSTASGAGTLRLLNSGSGAAVNVTGTGHTIATALALDDAADFNVATGGRLGISSVIATGSTGAQSLTKSGPGILELSGANTYSGDTTVSAGTLIVNGSLGNGALTVATNAMLMGSGTIGGAATILGAHSPGNSPGIETFASGLTYSGGSSQVIWELWGNTTSNSPPTINYDQIIVGGNLDFAGGTILSLDFGGSGVGAVNWSNSFWDTNQSWTLFDVAGTTSGFGNFTLASAPSAWLDSNGLAFSASSRSANSFRVAQLGTDVMVEYVIVPEPGSLTLVGIGIAAAASAARRRRAGQRRSRATGRVVEERP